METTPVSQKSLVKTPSPKSLPIVLSENKALVRATLQLYKDRGKPNFPALLTIEAHNRIPALVRDNGEHLITAAISGALYSAFSNLNLRVHVNEDQVLDIAAAIIEEAYEDQLSIEDVLLFLQQLAMGKAGKIFDRMDMPTFFELFEGYRQERHIATLKIREEQQAQYKGFGDTNRTSDEKDLESWREARDILIAKYDLKQKSAQQTGPTGTPAPVL